MKNYITAEEAQQFVTAARERIERFEKMARNTWDRGIAAYASDLINYYAIDIVGYPDENGCVAAPTEQAFLNGATSWYEYAAGGCGAALIYDESIIKAAVSAFGREAVEVGSRWLPLPDKRRRLHQHRGRGDRARVFDHCIGGPSSLEEPKVLT